MIFKKSLKAVFLGLGIMLTSSAVATTNKVFSDYLARKNVYLKILSKIENSSAEASKARLKEDEKAIAELTKMLQTAFGIAGFMQPTTLLNDDPDSADLDGLVFDFKTHGTKPRPLVGFVTDVALLSPVIPSFGQSSQLSQIAPTLLAHDDAKHYPVFEIKGLTKSARATGRNDQIYAFVGLAAQDIGPFLPNEVMILMRTGSRIYAVRYGIDGVFKPYKSCERTWGVVAAKTIADNDNKQFNKYLQCYGANLRKTGLPVEVIRSAQDALDALVISSFQ